MTRTVFRCWLVSLLLGPACAFALEVGEIQVDSALNQLFDARIPLPTLSPEELGGISVKVASPSMFKEFGLDRGATLDNLVFSIQYDAEGKVYVKVVSIKPIHEPSLALLLEFGWPRGKTFREFTVLLDPVRRLVERPAGRSKTVLNAPADIGSESTSEPPSADIVVNRTIQYPDRPGASVETASSAGGSWIYRPGDVYGPVAPGEGLWGIALKVRPDPGITRDQMMQALFRANPEAFTKAGVDGLRIGALLRIPTFQEIADFTGSVVARQLAAAEQATAEGVGTGLASTGEAPASTVEPMAAGTNASNLAVFPLARPGAFESSAPAPEAAAVAVAGPKPEGSAPGAVAVAVAEPKPEVAEPAAVAVAGPKPEGSAPEAVAVAVAGPKPEVAEPAAVAVAEPKPEVAEPAAVAVAEPKPEGSAPEAVAVAVADLKPDAAEPDPASGVAVSEPVASMVFEPVSATPLLFLVVSEVMASATAQIPRAPISVQTPSSAVEQTADVASAEPPYVSDADATLVSEKVRQAVAEPGAAHQAIADAPTSVTPDVSEPPLAADSVEAPVVESIAPSVGETAEAARTVEAAEPSVAETAEVIIEDTEVAGAAESVAPAAVGSVKPTAPVDDGRGEQYGPVAPNERLWDIAAKVRPDPSIGIDVMMKALFAINPTAFSKMGMDYLKVGVNLRVPTLREITEHTNSKTAKQLLEQQTAANKATSPAGSTQDPLPPPPVATPGAGSDPDPDPGSGPVSAAEPAPEQAPPATGTSPTAGSPPSDGTSSAD